MHACLRACVFLYTGQPTDQLSDPPTCYVLTSIHIYIYYIFSRGKGSIQKQYKSFCFI